MDMAFNVQDPSPPVFFDRLTTWSKFRTLETGCFYSCFFFHAGRLKGGDPNRLRASSPESFELHVQACWKRTAA